MKRARLYEKIEKGDGSTIQVRCRLCSHRCTLDNRQTGICKVRKNIDGELYSLNYDNVAATHMDPIEKKPLYHFLPGSQSFSIAAMGCNFRCKFCQNYRLSQVSNESHIQGEAISPRQLVEAALRYSAESISYTYSEPTIYYELMFETAQIAKEKGIKNVMVTNGYMSGEALSEIAPYIDAANIDLKSFSDDFYKKYCGGRLQPVLDTIKGMKEKGIWIELTTLLIPGLNDNPDEIKKLIAFIVEVDRNIPWHVSRFFPQHRLTDLPPTNPAGIFSCLEMAAEMGLKYLYAGNVNSDNWENTRCPQCSQVLIHRRGYYTQLSHFSGGNCESCGHSIAGTWK